MKRLKIILPYGHRLVIIQSNLSHVIGGAGPGYESAGPRPARAPPRRIPYRAGPGRRLYYGTPTVDPDSGMT
eukprot:753131-Hanusia_phi.AAC.4